MLMSRARADLQKIMALKRAILESAVLLGYSSMQNRSCDCFCGVLYHHPQNILKPHPITKYDALCTSVQKKSGHSEQLDHASLTRPLFFNHPVKKKISGLARETTWGLKPPPPPQIIMNGYDNQIGLFIYHFTSVCIYNINSLTMKRNNSSYVVYSWLIINCY